MFQSVKLDKDVAPSSAFWEPKSDPDITISPHSLELLIML